MSCFLTTGTTSWPSDETSTGSSPQSHPKVEAPPLINYFSPGLKSGYSMVCFPLIKNAG
jgi:hypothetical protein